MVVFFDILLLDDDACLKMPHRERRLLLQDVIKTIPGRAALAEQEVLDFGRMNSQHRLAVSFSNAITQRWEGYVLKACEEPYFPIYSAGVDSSFGRWIKLKKDYIPGLGDTVDLALVGASYDVQDAAALSWPKKLRWTHFLVGCLLNKEQVIEADAVPRFRAVDAVNRHSMHRDTLQYLNQHGEFYACDPDGFDGFDIEYGNSNLPIAAVLFKRPFIAEMMGAGFEKPSGSRYFTLRFPRILKIHSDRTFEEAASHRELQLLAENARSVPVEDMLDEREQWCKRLKAGRGLDHYIVQRSESPSSRGSSAESDAHSEFGDSSATFSDGKICPDSFGGPAPGHQHTSQDARMYSSGEGAPAMYVDETIYPDRPTSPLDENVLSENQNLSCRQSSSQASYFSSQTSEKLTRPEGNRAKEQRCKARSVGPSNAQLPSSLRSVHEQHNHQTILRDEYSSQIQLSTPLPPSKPTPRSPLTTIPVYRSGRPPRKTSDREEGSSTDLLEFLSTLGSHESRSELQHSNPEAASKGIAFGIVLVNPGGTRLGQEIHRTTEALCQLLHKRTSHSDKGGIFFLDSVILEQDIQPEDLSFCLRKTWLDIGREYYYACLRWDLDERFRYKDSEKRTHSLSQLNSKPKTSSGIPPAVTVSFDEAEILMFGEYTSIDPLLHVNDE